MTSTLHLTVPLPSGEVAEVVAANGEHEIHAESIRIGGRACLLLVTGEDRNAIEQAMWDARMALDFAGADTDDKCAGCKLGPASACNAECGRGADDDGQPDEAQEWHDYDRYC